LFAFSGQKIGVFEGLFREAGYEELANRIGARRGSM